MYSNESSCMCAFLAKRVFAMSVQSSPATDKAVARALKDVAARIDSAVKRSGRTQPVRLVAVSKTKPAEAIQEAYDAGHRDFGENYVQELLDKAPLLPGDIRWHFIGHLQSNKARALLEGVAGLACVQTVDSAKLADRLNRIATDLQRQQKLGVMLQVNTSGEESKYGCAPGEAVGLAQHIAGACPALQLAGLMTIGMPDYSSRPENFTCLVECRAQVAAALGVSADSLELSMGMSGDFEQAVEMGSTNVRVGSTIFGARDYSK